MVQKKITKRILLSLGFFITLFCSSSTSFAQNSNLDEALNQYVANKGQLKYEKALKTALSNLYVGGEAGNQELRVSLNDALRYQSAKTPPRYRLIKYWKFCKKRKLLSKLIYHNSHNTSLSSRMGDAFSRFLSKPGRISAKWMALAFGLVTSLQYAVEYYQTLMNGNAVVEDSSSSSNVFSKNYPFIILLCTVIFGIGVWYYRKNKND